MTPLNEAKLKRSVCFTSLEETEDVSEGRV